MAREPRALSAYDHFAVMVFAQLTYRESLSDIEACLLSRCLPSVASSSPSSTAATAISCSL